MRHEIFENKLQVEQDLQYIAEIKYMVKGETSKLNSATELLPVMSHSKFTASEHVGSMNDDGLTPVTVRFFVDEETFNQLRGEDGNGAKFSNPFHYEDLNNGKVPQKLAKSMKAWLHWRRRLKNENRVQYEASSPNGEKITAINLAVYASEEFVAEKYGKKWAIVGDAALGVPYFRALNAGLLCGTELAKALSAPSSLNSTSSLRKRGSSLDSRLHENDGEQESDRSVGVALVHYSQYVQKRVQKEIKKAKAKDSAVKFGWFFVNKSVTDVHFSRFKLKSLHEEDININDLLTIYLLEGCQGMDDAYKYHDILDYSTGDNLLQRAQEFTMAFSNACKVAKTNMGDGLNDARLNDVANSLKADVYQHIHTRQLELRDSRWKTAWLLTVIGLLLPIISHIAIWAWYAHHRINEPLTATTLTEKEFLNIYHENNPQILNDIISMLSVLSAKSPLREKHHELRARRDIVPITERLDDDRNDEENSRDSSSSDEVVFRYADVVTGVTIFSTNWNQQAEHFEEKVLAV